MLHSTCNPGVGQVPFLVTNRHLDVFLGLHAVLPDFLVPGIQLDVETALGALWWLFVKKHKLGLCFGCEPPALLFQEMRP